jgi:geranial dehydrogenase
VIGVVEKLYIGGEWRVPDSEKKIEVISASTGEKIGIVPEASRTDVDAAVVAARKALHSKDWGGLSGAERAGVLNRFADAVEKRGDRLARSVSMQNGMPLLMSQQLESGFVVGMLRYYATLATTLVDEELRQSPLGFSTLVRRERIGVVGAIVPWNFPVALAIMKIGPALAAGCSVVLKPSPETVLDCYILAEAAEEAGVPPGVLNWVPGGRDIGAYLVTHPGVDKVAFTGSTTAGRTIAQECGKILRPVSLELGGKSAAIILEDADLASFLKAIPSVSMLNSGQACFSCTRILAPKSRYQEIVDAIAAVVSSLPIGDPLDQATVVGPMVTSAHRDRVESYIEKGKTEGRLVAGGGRPKHLEQGWYVEPTVFAGVSNHSTIAQEEIFGPVLTVIEYQDDSDAVAIANDSQYGLGGSIWTADIERAKKLACQIETGTVGINGYLPDLNAPFGGVKSSGLGRELGPESVSAYQKYKSIYLMG